jgi:16S rRNA G1207 methylase RsmC
MKAAPDYAKLSLYLGGVSMIGAGLYWYWVYTNNQTEKKLRVKYDQAKEAIKVFQIGYGLYPSGKLDAATQLLLSKLGAQQGHES